MKFIFTFSFLFSVILKLHAQCGITNFQYTQNINQVSFTDNSIPASGISIVSYSWDFGDGNSSTSMNPTHVYSSPGFYSVKHSFKGSNNCNSDTLIKMVFINTVTPVSIDNFKTISINNQLLLEWNTLTESNFAYFIIQKSLDGNSFSSITNIYPSATKKYSFTDVALAKGVNYYRLKMVDKDGSYEFSKVISFNNLNSSLNFYIFPNPAIKKTINIELKNFSHTSQIQVSVFDIVGKLQKQALQFAINGKVTIDHHFAKGIYKVVVQQNEQQVSKILVVE